MGPRRSANDRAKIGYRQALLGAPINDTSYFLFSRLMKRRSFAPYPLSLATKYTWRGSEVAHQCQIGPGHRAGMRVFDAQNLTGPHIPRRGAKANPKQIQPSGRGDANHNKHIRHLDRSGLGRGRPLLAGAFF